MIDELKEVFELAINCTNFVELYKSNKRKRFKRNVFK